MLEARMRPEPLRVHGRPFVFWSANGEEEDLYNNNCEVIEVSIRVGRIAIQTVSAIGHRGIDPAFTGSYPVIIGSDEATNEYIFGVRPELEFRVEAFSDLVPEEFQMTDWGQTC